MRAPLQAHIHAKAIKVIKVISVMQNLFLLPTGAIATPKPLHPTGKVATRDGIDKPPHHVLTRGQTDLDASVHECLLTPVSAGPREPGSSLKETQWPVTP